MKKKTKIFNCNVGLLLLILLLVGCTDKADKQPKSEHPDNDPASVSESSTGSEKSTTDDSSDNSLEKSATYDSDDHSSENKQKETDVAEHNDSRKETNKGNSDSEEETNIDKNESQKNIDNSNTQSDTQTNQIQTNTDKNDQKEAISLVEDYLRERNELIEDEDHFVQYDGEVKHYIIVRYSTLVSGHSSTNGRYAVDINSGKIVDISANPDFFNS